MNNNHRCFYSTHIDLLLEFRTQIVEVLNPRLQLPSTKNQVKQAHWNVKGINFYQLHELFDAIASELERYIDLFAERITARIAAQYSTLPEYPLENSEGKYHLQGLAERLAIYAMSLRESIDVTVDLGDADTSESTRKFRGRLTRGCGFSMPICKLKKKL